MKIQEALAVVQINTFVEALEKAHRIESARLQVKTFQARKRNIPSGTLGQTSKSMPPPKIGRETGRIKMLEPLRVAPVRRGQGGPRQSKNTSQGSQGVTSHAPYGYCEKSSHVESNCWRKGKRCFHCENAEHQISSCPLMVSKRSNTQ